VPATPTPRPTATPVPTSSSGAPLANAQLAITSPADGAQVAPGSVTISGTSNAGSVVITAMPASGGSASPAASPAPLPTAGNLVNATVTNGQWTQQIQLGQGDWTIEVATLNAGAQGLADTNKSITVHVQPFSGLTVTVSAENGSAWIQVWVDGTAVDRGSV